MCQWVFLVAGWCMWDCVQINYSARVLGKGGTCHPDQQCGSSRVFFFLVLSSSSTAQRQTRQAPDTQTILVSRINVHRWNPLALKMCFYIVLVCFLLWHRFIVVAYLLSQKQFSLFGIREKIVLSSYPFIKPHQSHLFCIHVSTVYVDHCASRLNAVNQKSATADGDCCCRYHVSVLHLLRGSSPHSVFRDSLSNRQGLGTGHTYTHAL